MGIGQVIQGIIKKIPPTAVTWLTTAIVAAFILGSFLILDSIRHGYSITIYDHVFAGRLPEQEVANKNCLNLQGSIVAFSEPVSKMADEEKTRLTDLRAQLDEARGAQRSNWSVHQDRSDAAARRGDQIDAEIARIQTGSVKTLADLQLAIDHHREACVRISSTKS